MQKNKGQIRKSFGEAHLNRSNFNFFKDHDEDRKTFNNMFNANSNTNSVQIFISNRLQRCSFMTRSKPKIMFVRPED